MTYKIGFLKPSAAGLYTAPKGYRIHSVLDQYLDSGDRVNLKVLLESTKPC